MDTILYDFIYDFGLIVVTIYLLLGLDDLILDIAHALAKKRLQDGSVPFERLDDLPPKLLGVVVAAWNEEAVIEQVVSNMVDSYLYPRSMYHIFVGTYPNDTATVAKVRQLEQRYSNVHMVVSAHDGPTNKADNINQILGYIKKFERAHDWEFASITVHDSEDIVHPYELKMTNYLINEHDAIQMPVFPLQAEPKASKFFKQLTRATYTAEFAENHYRTMNMREILGGVVPSAGTGFVLTRRVLEYLGDNPFPVGSLTEDYKLSLTLAEHGFRVHYALGKVHRLGPNGKLEWDFVATRSIFPGTFKTAVRQKTRWVYGITMQSVSLKDIFIRRHAAGFVQRLSVLKDLKAKLSNLMSLPGYMVLAYFIASLLMRLFGGSELPAMYPAGSLSFWLSVALSAMMLERQYIRALALYKVYGWRYVVHCSLLPPILPLSLVWGNIINFTSTILAWKQHFFGKSPSKKRQRKARKWNKTDHEFPDTDMLRTFHRDLPDLLLQRGLVNAETLADAIRRGEQQGRPFEDILLYDGAALEEDLAQSFASVYHTVYLKGLAQFVFPRFAEVFDEADLREHCMYPLLSLDGGYVYAVAMDAFPAAVEHISAEHRGAEYVLATRDAIHKAIDALYAGRYSLPTHLLELVRSGQINWEQTILAMEHEDDYADIARHMGIHVPSSEVTGLDEAKLMQLYDAV